MHHHFIKGKLILSHKQTHITIDHIKHRTVYKVTCVLLQICVNWQMIHVWLAYVIVER